MKKALVLLIITFLIIPQTFGNAVAIVIIDGAAFLIECAESLIVRFSSVEVSKDTIILSGSGIVTTGVSIVMYNNYNGHEISYLDQKWYLMQDGKITMINDYYKKYTYGYLDGPIYLPGSGYEKINELINSVNYLNDNLPKYDEENEYKFLNVNLKVPIDESITTINEYAILIQPTNVNFKKLYSFREYKGVYIHTDNIIKKQYILPVHCYFVCRVPTEEMDTLNILSSAHINDTYIFHKTFEPKNFIPVDYKIQAIRLNYNISNKKFSIKNVYLSKIDTYDCKSKIDVKGTLSTDDVINLIKTAIDTPLCKGEFVCSSQPQIMSFNYNGDEYEALFIYNSNASRIELVSIYPKSSQYLSYNPDIINAYLCIKGDRYRIIEPGVNGICLSIDN